MTTRTRWHRGVLFFSSSFLKKDKDKLFSSDISSRRHFTDAKQWLCKVLDKTVLWWVGSLVLKMSLRGILPLFQQVALSHLRKQLQCPSSVRKVRFHIISAPAKEAAWTPVGVRGIFQTVGKISKFSLVKVLRARTFQCFCSACLLLCYFVICFSKKCF